MLFYTLTSKWNVSNGQIYCSRLRLAKVLIKSQVPAQPAPEGAGNKGKKRMKKFKSNPFLDIEAALSGR